MTEKPNSIYVCRLNDYLVFSSMAWFQYIIVCVLFYCFLSGREFCILNFTYGFIYCNLTEENEFINGVGVIITRNDEVEIGAFFTFELYIFSMNRVFIDFFHCFKSQNHGLITS